MDSRSDKSRNNILDKIRNSLNEHKVPKPFPEVDSIPTPSVFAKQDLSAEENFADAFIKLGGKFIFCENELDFLENIAVLYDDRNWQQLLCAEEHLLELFHQNKMNVVQTADQKAEGADACITGCELLVGRTGSIIFSSKQHLGRTSPVFYPVHIVVAYAGQVVDDLGDGIDAIKGKYNNGLPSMINLNTGPSRTADIEKTLVVGVHGPGEVLCFYINKPYKNKS
ncbi:MAG: lactate utilization protein B/C [Sphingobacteriales bacterium]|nr:MAG: lactate utilization protein B/C [Sphingobacteriales bacterium]